VQLVCGLFAIAELLVKLPMCLQSYCTTKEGRDYGQLKVLIYDRSRWKPAQDCRKENVPTNYGPEITNKIKEHFCQTKKPVSTSSL